MSSTPPDDLPPTGQRPEPAPGLLGFAGVPLPIAILGGVVVLALLGYAILGGAQAALNIAIIVACGAVAVVLVLGLWNMLRGGDGNTSQKLMRLRVILQAVAILLLMGALFFFGGNRGG